MQFICLVIVFVIVGIIGVNCDESKPTYDHQTKTYDAKFHPLVVKGTKATVTPYFSPDHSISTTAKWLQEAQSTIDISNPGFGSWSGCASVHSGCMGCTAEDIITNEKFPVFQVLNNAIHNGIKVRILTNDYEDPLCEGQMDLLTYLQIAGAEVRYYTTTSFTHSKYIAVDNDTLLISSVNFSKTSFMQNREAGLIIRNNAEVYNYCQSVFESDFNQGYVKDLPKYDPKVIQQIKDANHISVVVPEPYNYKYCNVTSPNTYPISGVMDISVLVSPDFTYDPVMDSIKSAQSQFWLSIYQITDDDFCQALIDLNEAKKDLDMKIFVSNKIFGAADQKLALQCYKRLYEAGIVVKFSAKYCLEFSHQKYWIVDGESVLMSTGNWSPTDYPSAPYTFPPYGQPGWRKINRDYTVRIDNSNGIVKRFSDVFTLDYNQSYPYSPTMEHTHLRR